MGLLDGVPFHSRRLELRGRGSGVKTVWAVCKGSREVPRRFGGSGRARTLRAGPETWHVPGTGPCHRRPYVDRVAWDRRRLRMLASTVCASRQDMTHVL